MDMVEKLVAEDEAIKGIWCVPKYSNPTGSTYSDEVVRRLANMKTAAEDFRIFWDNAYAVHYIYQNDPLLNIMDECKKAGNADRVFIFASTSKITFPGSGVAVIAASEDNIAFIKKQIANQAISWDKMNMLRHVRFFKNVDGILEQMAKHAEVLRPRFNAVVDAFERELGPRGVGTWIKPNGGYFITYFTMDGCAKRVVSLCKDAGVVLTGAGATHPYKKDPKDNTIRIAPSFPTTEELSLAVELFNICVRLASLEVLLAN
jgi:DNA-binding transcriptional MocR family regulator